MMPISPEQCAPEVQRPRLPPRPSRLAGIDLTQGSVARVLITFSLPVILQMSIQPIYMVTDRIFIGQIGPDAFAAVTNAATLQMFIIVLAAGLANGATSYIARLMGEGDYAEVDNAAMHAMIMMFIASALILALLLPSTGFFFHALGLQEKLFPLANGYIRIIIIGNVIMMFGLIASNMLRGEGNSKVPFIISLLSTILNLFLAPLFIFSRHDLVFGLRIGWLGLSLPGAALATVISQAAGCLMLIIYLMQGKTVWTMSLQNFHWYPQHIWEFLRVGLPMFLLNMVSWFATLVFLKVLNPYGHAVVAYGMGIQLDALAVMPMIGLSIGVLSMVGQNYGAGLINRARRAAWLGGVFAGVFSGIMGLLFVLFPWFWVRLFNKTHDPVVDQLSRNYIYIVSFTYLLVSQVFVLGGAFQGLGKGLPPLIITSIRFLTVAVPLSVILTPAIGPKGAWIGIASSHCVGGIMAIVWLSLEFRKHTQLPSCPETAGEKI